MSEERLSETERISIESIIRREEKNRSELEAENRRLRSELEAAREREKESKDKGLVCAACKEKLPEGVEVFRLKVNRGSSAVALLYNQHEMREDKP